MNFPRIGIYHSLRGDEVLTQEQIDDLARWDYVITDLGCANANPQNRRALLQANPKMKFLAYVVMKAWDNPNGPIFFRDFWRLMVNTNGFLICTNGKWWSFSNVNVANYATIDMLADLILAHAMDWDEHFLDVLIPELWSADQGGGEVLDWAKMGFSSERSFLDMWKANAKHLVQRLSVKGVTTNYGIGFPGTALGNMTESFHALTDGTWNGNMVQWGAQPGLLKLGFPAPWICTRPFDYNPNSIANQRKSRYGLGSALLAGGFHSFGRYEDDEAWRKVRLKFFAKEFVHPQLGRGWLGEPTEAAHQSRSDKFIWMREFQRGLVVVNIDKKPHSIYLPNRYCVINGPVKDGFSVPGEDALIMEKK